MTEEEKKASENRSELTARGAMVGTGVVAAALGHPVEGALLVGAAESVANAAKNLYQTPTAQRLQEFVGSIPAWRISKTFRRVEERIVEEGIDPDPERMADLFEQAIPFVGNASTEEKRKMMEEIIMNGARRSQESVAQIEAKYALSLIDEYPDAVVLIFSAIVSELKSKNTWFLPKPFPHSDLPQPILKEIEAYIDGKVSSAKSIIDGVGAETNQGNGSRFVVNYYESECEFYGLTSAAFWLSKWVVNNSDIENKDPSQIP